MCGIGLIVSGVDMSCTSQVGASRKVPGQVPDAATTPCLLDLIGALRRRGPDSCGVRTVYLGATENIKQSGGSCTVGKLRNAVEQCAEFNNQCSDSGELICCISNSGKKFSVCCSELSSENPICKSYDPSQLRPTDVASPNLAASLQFVGTTLQLRGKHAVSQPLRDSDGNILIYNGEVFGGLEVGPEENDTQVVLSALQECCCRLTESDSSKGQSIPEVLSQIRGPWALIYWQAAAQTLWFGRDGFGRRSLLVHWPSDDDPRFLLSSVSPAHGVPGEAYNPFSFWEELACGIYSIHIEDGCLESTSSAFKGVTRIHDWQDSLLKKLISWERPSNESEVASGNANCNPREDAVGSPTKAKWALRALKQAVKRRIVNNRINQSSCIEAGGVHQQTPIAVLFSGGIDSMILAALADQCLDPSYAIDLLNVSFEGSSAPDRISAVAGLSELQRISPTRSWRLVEIDEELGVHGNHILFLICPSQTYMDSNIGTALWSAAGGDGSVHNGLNSDDATQRYYRYRSEARVVLVGAGADEQCGGYLRYRTKFKLGGWEALAAEMRLDMQRLWKRNLGRDDRCIADHGKEARFPFLDENVIETFLGIPLHEVADLREDIGIGDKKILRQVARLLGLSRSAALPKRAIQFGTGIARQSNRKNFGSNRAANKLSAGSVQVRKNIEDCSSQPSVGPNPAVTELCTITETEI